MPRILWWWLAWMAGTYLSKLNFIISRFYFQQIWNIYIFSAPTWVRSCKLNHKWNINCGAFSALDQDIIGLVTLIIACPVWATGVILEPLLFIESILWATDVHWTGVFIESCGSCISECHSNSLLFIAMKNTSASGKSCLEQFHVDSWDSWFCRLILGIVSVSCRVDLADSVPI